MTHGRSINNELACGPPVEGYRIPITGRENRECRLLVRIASIALSPKSSMRLLVQSVGLQLAVECSAKSPVPVQPETGHVQGMSCALGSVYRMQAMYDTWAHWWARACTQFSTYKVA
jgi:hypothetical protein